MGGEGKIIEADETYYGRSNTGEVKRQYPRSKKSHKDQRPKRAIVSLVERGGSVRSFHVASANKATVAKIVTDNVHPLSRLHTDESKLYTGAEAFFAAHETVRHTAGEYARGDVTTNSVEGYFSIFKRGMRGTYQHCAEKHLHRYLAEFDFRFNNRAALGVSDSQRATAMIKGAEGKRLTYRRTREQYAAGA
jgi:transposase-like protein